MANLAEERAREVLDGLMLGDGSLTRFKNGAIYNMAQSKRLISLEDHLKWEYWLADNVFMTLGIPLCKGCPRLRSKNFQGKLLPYAHLGSCLSSLLGNLYDEWYAGGEWVERSKHWYIKGGVKRLPERLVQATTLPISTIVHWFLGDGGSSRQYWRNPLWLASVIVTFATCCFTEREVYRLIAAFNHMGIRTIGCHKNIVSRGSGLSIQLAQDSINPFMDLVGASILEIFGDSKSPSYRDMIKYKKSVG